MDEGNECGSLDVIVHAQFCHKVVSDYFDKI